MDPNTSNIFGVKSGINLTDIVNLNQNPFDIPKIVYPIVTSWNAFQKYLQNNDLVRNPSFNKNQIDTTKIINNYNDSIVDTTNPYTQKITQTDIIAAQTFHKINDSKVQIDGWVGSQTSQLKYPKPITFYSSIDPKSKNSPPVSVKGWLPTIWGNKRFVVDAQVITDYVKKGLYPPYSFLILYDENTHKDTLQTSFIPKEWYTLGQNVEVAKNAIQVDLQREVDNVKSNVNKTITNIKVRINSTIASNP